MFTPYLTIGVGATGAYFTLRETYERVPVVGSSDSYITSFHHFNLAQDADEAFDKAKHYSEVMAIQLHTTKDQMVEEMRTIERATAEQLAARQKAIEDKEQQQKNDKDNRDAYLLSIIAKGQYPTGRYADCDFNIAPIQYINWIATANFEEIVMQTLQQAVKTTCADMLLPIGSATETMGTVGEKITADVTVTKVYGFNGYYGFVNIITMVTSTGVTLVAKGSFNAAVGDKIKIKATVKEHNEYKNQAQTIVNRVKIIK